MTINPSIINIILENMIIAQREQVMDKKQFTLLMVKSVISEESYIKYQPIIEIIIDALKALSKTNVLQNLKNKKCKCINI